MIRAGYLGGFGHCAREAVGLPDGPIRPAETLERESRDGGGTGAVEALAASRFGHVQDVTVRPR